MLKATATDIALRYSSASDLAEDLRRFIAGRPITATAPGFWYITRKFVARHRLPVSLAAGFMLALMATLIIAVTGWNEARRQRDTAMANADRAAFIGDFLFETLLLTTDIDTRGAPPALTDGTIQAIAERAIEGLPEDPENMLRVLEGIVSYYEDAEGVDAMDHYQALFALSMKHRFGPTPQRQVELNRRLHEIAADLYGPESNAAIDSLGLYGEALGTFQPSEQARAMLNEAAHRLREAGADPEAIAILEADDQ